MNFCPSVGYRIQDTRFIHDDFEGSNKIDNTGRHTFVGRHNGDFFRVVQIPSNCCFQETARLILVDFKV